MDRRDQLSGLFWLGISVFVCWEAVGAKFGTFNNPGAGFLPLLLGATLGTFSITLILTSFLKKRTGGRIRDLWKGTKWSKAILVLVFIFLYAAFVKKVGYLIATFGLMAVLFAMTEKQKIWIVLGSAFITAMLSYIVFCVCLGIQF